MYTLDINSKTIKKTIITYVIITILLYIGSSVYLNLSYGADSIYMKYVAIIPLILGVVVYSVVYLLKKVKHSRLAYNLYNAGVFTFIVGSILQGILELCGSNSSLTLMYLIIGSIFIFISIVKFILVQKEHIN